MFEKAKISLTVPDFKAPADHVGSPIPFGILTSLLPKGLRKTPPLLPSLQSVIPMQFLIALGLLNFITVDLDNQKWVLIRGPYLSRRPSSKISYLGPRETAENPKIRNANSQEIPPSCNKLKNSTHFLSPADCPVSVYKPKFLSSHSFSIYKQIARAVHNCFYVSLMMINCFHIFLKSFYPV